MKKFMSATIKWYWISTAQQMGFLPISLPPTVLLSLPSVRHSIRRTTGETYTRVVFDLTGKMEYKVTPNAAKNQVTLAFEQVEIKSITSSHSGSTETVTINASGADRRNSDHHAGPLPYGY